MYMQIQVWDMAFIKQDTKLESLDTGNSSTIKQ